MVSPELIRRYPFFAGLSLGQINTLSNVAGEEKVEAGHFFLHEGDEVSFLYLVVDGTVAAVINVPVQEREIVVGTVGPGEVFAWSALVPPHTATASVKAITPCHVVVIDCPKLLRVFEEEDPQFGYLMMKRAAQVIRDRVAAMTIEALAYFAENTGEEE